MYPTSSPHISNRLVSPPGFQTHCITVFVSVIAPGNRLRSTIETTTLFTKNITYTSLRTQINNNIPWLLPEYWDFFGGGLRVQYKPDSSGASHPARFVSNAELGKVKVEEILSVYVTVQNLTEKTGDDKRDTKDWV